METKKKVVWSFTSINEIVKTKTENEKESYEGLKLPRTIVNIKKCLGKKYKEKTLQHENVFNNDLIVMKYKL